MTNRPSLLPLSALFGVGVALSLPVFAFPPAPGFTVYGNVRDPLGWVVDSADATIILSASSGAVEIARSAIRSGRVNENYRVMLPLDQNRSGEAYKPGAVEEATPFVITVEIDGLTYLPVETVVTPVEGAKAAEFLRLDLTLGTDSDGDGLPDLWEQWQLETAGLPPFALDLINPEDDLDHDGLTNYQEYIAGTFAYLGTDRLSLAIKNRGSDGWNRLEFLAIIDKTYVIEQSTDLKTWTPVSFTLSDDRTALRTEWKATDTVMRSVQIESAAPTATYRLTVR